MPTNLDRLIARVPQWASAKKLETSVLPGGITNQNVHVVVNDEAFVLRLGGENTDLLGICREHEYVASVAAAALGIAPEVVYFIRPEGYLVTRFVKGYVPTPDEIGQQETIQLVAQVLRRVHAIEAIPGEFSPFRIVERYAETARGLSVPFPENFGWLVERINEIEDSLRADGFQPCPCHNDLLNGNFLRNGEVIHLLDWEYAGMGDLFFDLGNFAVNHNFSDDQDRYLLQCYFGSVSRSHLARLKLMKTVSDFREAMWGIVQIGISKLDFDFRRYADTHFHRLTLGFQDPRRKQWLAEVGGNA